MFIGGLSALLLQSLHPLAMAGVDAALRVPRRPVGPPRPDQPLPGRHDVRLGRRRPPTDRRRAGRAPPGHRDRPRRPAVRGVRSAPAVVGPPRRGRQLPAGLPALRRRAADRGRVPTSTSPRPAGSPRALGAVDVPATVAERRAPSSRRTGPSWPARRPPGPPPASSSPTRRCRVGPAPGVPADRRRRRRASCPAGPAGRCACRGCPSPRPPSAAPPASVVTRDDPLGAARRLTFLTLLAPAQRERRLRRTRSAGRNVAGMDRLVLASGSPRRRELLGPARADVHRRAGRRRRDAAARGATARPGAPPGRRQGARPSTAIPVLAADTIVEVDGQILGKPADADDARRMLRPAVGARPPRPHGRGVRAGGRLDVEVVTTT